MTNKTDPYLLEYISNRNAFKVPIAILYKIFVIEKE